MIPKCIPSTTLRHFLIVSILLMLTYASPNHPENRTPFRNSSGLQWTRPQTQSKTSYVVFLCIHSPMHTRQCCSQDSSRSCVNNSKQMRYAERKNDYTALLSTCKMKESFASPQVSILVSLRLRWERPICCPQVNQGLHRLQFLRFKHVQRSCCQNKVRETAIELFFKVQVIERLGEMCPVKVGVHTKHLTENHLANFEKLLWEARPFPNVFGLSGVGKLR